MPPDPLCVRLPADLDAIVRERAMFEGLTASEMLRALISQWIYQQTPSVDEGYYNARQLAMKLAHEAVSRACAIMVDDVDVSTMTPVQIAHYIVSAALVEMPETYEQAVALLEAARG